MPGRIRAAATALLCVLALSPPAAIAQEWLLASVSGRVVAGAPFQVVVASLAGEALPEELAVRIKNGEEERVVVFKAAGPALGSQRAYEGRLPANAKGPVTLDLPDRSSSVLVLLVEAAGPAPAKPEPGAPVQSAKAVTELPLSENDPMYFVVGPRGGYTARFQLSFKYRLFDQSAGVGRERPWLAGFYFGYTQNSLWDLSSESHAFRDTSYRPSFFWKWQRTDDRTWLDGFRAGLEHESNGKDGDRSRSVNTAFVRPEWRWNFADDSQLDFTPKLYGYLEKDDNPDIYRYRGYVDWRVRYDSGFNWITTGVARLGSARKGSLAIDLSRRIRDLRFGPVGGYLHLQFFSGYGEDILDYNRRRATQLRIGFAIVP